jgi:hypothetical protein
VTSTRARRAALFIGLAALTGVVIGASPANAAAGPPVPVPGAPASTSAYTEFNGLLYLSGVAEADIYSSLFSFDGTTFTQIPGSPVGPTQFHVLGDELVFEAVVDINALPSYAYGLFVYDGTTITQVPGPFETPNDFVSIGSTVYFQATVGGEVQLWQYDGTAASAVPGGAVDPRRLSTYNGKLYFAGDTDPSPTEAFTLFSYDPATPAVAAAAVLGAPADPGELVPYDGLAYLGAPGGLYTFDGAATFAPVGIAPATGPYGLTVFDGALYFTAGDGSDTNVFFFIGGVTTKVPGAVTETLRYTEFNGSLYYLGFANGLPLMNVISGGQTSVVPGSPQYTFGMTVYGGKLYFSGDSDVLSNIMFVYEGPAALPATGADPRTAGLVALVLLLAGSAFAAVRTRRA